MNVHIVLLLSWVAILLPSAHATWGTCFTPLPAGYAATDDIPAHYQWAKILYDNVAGTNKTSYQNFNITVMWGDESCDNEYRSDTDCSGIVTAVLQRAYNLSITDNWAYAYLYAETTKDQTFGFSNIKTDEAATGDIFSIAYYQEPGTFGNTGHMGFITSPAYVIPSTEPIIPNTVQWALPILDQTSTPHFPNDSRSAGMKGLGTGVMRVYTDIDTGAITGYTWSPTRTAYYNQSYHPFYIAHLNQTYMYDHPFTPAPTNPPYPPWMDHTPSPAPSIDSSGAAFVQPVVFLATIAMLFMCLLFV